MNRQLLWIGAVVSVVTTNGLSCTVGAGQLDESRTRADAVLIVDGAVREVFRSQRQARIDFLVEIEVKRTQAERVPRTSPRVATPAPGEIVYVHASQRATGTPAQGLSGQNEPTREVRQVVPAERSTVRAYLVPSARGGWEGAGIDWFEITTNVLAEANPTDAPAAEAGSAPTTPLSPPVAPPSGGKSALSALGFTGESMNVKGQFVLRVSSVEQGGVAQRSGLEPGDIVIGANDAALGNLEQLAKIAQQGTLKNLFVLDVNTGKAVRVAVDMAPSKDSPSTRGAPTTAGNTPVAPSQSPADRNPAPAGGSRSLGISAEPVMVGRRTGMKVIRVEPGSPAQTAGIEVDDVIVAANGVAVTGVEVLSSVLKKSGPSLTLTVRDTRTGRDVPVEIKVGGSESKSPAPIPTETRAATVTGRKLGAVTELVFYDVNPAVKVTELEPNSPAARAGLEPGDIITEANGTPILHPKTLDDVVRQSPAVLKLQVVDPRTNKKTPVDVNLDSR